MKIFIDTSFFFAALEISDTHHSEAIHLLEHLTETETMLCTTWDIVSETLTLLRTRSGYSRGVEFLERLLPRLLVIGMDESGRQEALIVFKRFSKDKAISYCDCLSYVLLSGSFRLTPSLSFDRDFIRMGLPLYQP